MKKETITSNAELKVSHSSIFDFAVLRFCPFTKITCLDYSGWDY